MGQQSNGVGLRYGVIDGWNSSWSINSKDDIEYRDLVQISSDVEKLVTNLFRLNQGYIGKVGISKNARSDKIIINVFGYAPANYKFVENRFDTKKNKSKTKMVSTKKQLTGKLYRLAEVLSMKYQEFGCTFAVKACIVTEHSLGRKFYRKKKKKKGKQPVYVHSNFNSLKYIGADRQVLDLRKPKVQSEDDVLTPPERPFWLYKDLAKKRQFKLNSKQRRPKLLPKVLHRSRKKFGFLRRLNYYSTLMNIAYLTFKSKEPKFLAKFLAQELGKTRFQKSIYNNVDKVCAFLFSEFSEIQGIRIQVSGRMNKSKRTKTFVAQYGAITTQTVIHPLKYAFEEAYTIYGSMGVKIWISY